MYVYWLGVYGGGSRWDEMNMIGGAEELAATRQVLSMWISKAESYEPVTSHDFLMLPGYPSLLVRWGISSA
jgi:hypothetical protein